MKKLEQPILSLIALIALGSMVYAWSMKSKAHHTKKIIAFENTSAHASSLAVASPPTLATSPEIVQEKAAPTPIPSDETAPLPIPVVDSLSEVAPTPVPDVGLPPAAPTPSL